MSGDPLPWDDEARERLNRIPSFVRRLAKKKIEQVAKEAGYDAVTAQFMDESRSRLMK